MMAQVAWRRGMTESATFSLFFRGYPQNRSYYAVAGLETALEYLQSLAFTPEDLSYLESTSLFDSSFLSTLAEFRFKGSVRAMPEGTVAFSNEPVIEVTAPLVEAQIAETFLLNAVSFQTTILTKATRVRTAANGKLLFEFGARRAHGLDAADLAARCAFIAGFSGTSNLSAAASFGIPPLGTMAHSYVLAFADELEAFRAYAAEFPRSTTLLVDTFDTRNGVANAIRVAHEMENRGERLHAIRLDSGDLVALSREARSMLDSAGLEYVQVYASGALDEYSISQMLAEGAPIDGFGVGTRLVVSADAPQSESVYKLVSYAGRATGKLSSGKESLPGPKQVYRRVSLSQFTEDVIATADEDAPGNGQPLLQTVMEHGERTASAESLDVVRNRLDSQLAALPPAVRRVNEPAQYEVLISESLKALQRTVTDGHS
jgi:nicotinate phosphoribosyltransferase